MGLYLRAKVFWGLIYENSLLWAQCSSIISVRKIYLGFIAQTSLQTRLDEEITLSQRKVFSEKVSIVNSRSSFPASK